MGEVPMHGLAGNAGSYTGIGTGVTGPLTTEDCSAVGGYLNKKDEMGEQGESKGSDVLAETSTLCGSS